MDLTHINERAALLGFLAFIKIVVMAATFSPEPPPTEMPVEQVVQLAVEKGVRVYRPSQEILAKELAHIPYGEVADSALVASIEHELVSTGREMPDMWRDALTHPVGVQALKVDMASSVLWVGRVLLTETNRKAEMPQIAWVIRNRVENGFGGEWHYRTVILDRLQFSHFNTARGRAEMEGYGYHHGLKRFQEALEVALEVLTAPDSARPFGRDVQHYYSSVSMKPSYTTYCRKAHGPAVVRRLGKGHPKWAHDGPLAATGPDPNRFRFIAGV